MKKIKTQSSDLKVNSINFLKALKVRVAKSNSDTTEKNSQRNSNSQQGSVSKLGMV